jgi:hypothetical protein
VTSWFLRHEWAPVGTGDVPQIETDFTTAYLFGSGDGHELVDRIEDRIDALPGLAGLDLVRSSIAAATDRVVATEGSVPAPPEAAPTPEPVRVSLGSTAPPLDAAEPTIRAV